MGTSRSWKLGGGPLRGVNAGLRVPLRKGLHLHLELLDVLHHRLGRGIDDGVALEGATLTAAEACALGLALSTYGLALLSRNLWRYGVLPRMRR